jgi:hypothetical protein
MHARVSQSTYASLYFVLQTQSRHQNHRGGGMSALTVIINNSRNRPNHPRRTLIASASPPQHDLSDS